MEKAYGGVMLLAQPVTLLKVTFLHGSINHILDYYSNVLGMFLRPFSSFNDEKIKLQRLNKRISIRDNGNVQSRDKEESKSISTVSVNSGARTLTHDQMIKKKSIQ